MMMMNCFVSTGEVAVGHFQSRASRHGAAGAGAHLSISISAEKFPEQFLS
jgi:hypothetical protein